MTNVEKSENFDMDAASAQAGTAAYQIDTSAPSDILVYKYGGRPDKDCLPAIREQFMLANRLYNDLVAAMRAIIDAARAHTIALAGDDARALAQSIEAMTEHFLAARANQDKQRARQIRECLNE
ncbi:MAG: hypothetical protein ACYC9L_03205 [Sulfuricaulis sp.]